MFGYLGILIYLNNRIFCSVIEVICSVIKVQICSVIEVNCSAIKVGLVPSITEQNSSITERFVRLFKVN